MLREINFDGIVGPSHNFAGLSFGNLAAMRHAGRTSFPRDAALEGIAKMRVCLDLGLSQGILLPHRRPDERWLASLAASPERAGATLCANAMSASAMWAANAATVSPAPDCADRRCHLTVANLVTMPHRSHEWPDTLSQLRLAFADVERFEVHEPIPPPFGDEGAANHMRIASSHAERGVEVFVHGEGGGPYPARQHREASAAVARRHGLDPHHVLFVRQSPEAIAAGAFHNDVVAVSNENVLLVHQQAFMDAAEVYEALRARLATVKIIEVPSSAVSLADAIDCYLFNAQLVSLPGGGMALLVPSETRDNPRAWAWLQAFVGQNGTVRHLVPVAVNQSMGNGGGPACLRLRLVADPATIDPRFLVTAGKLDIIEAVVRHHWPENISPAQLAAPELWRRIGAARLALIDALELHELR